MNQTKLLDRVFWLMYAILFILSIVYAKEISLTLDGASIMTALANGEFYSFGNLREGTKLSQILPAFFIRMGLGLNLAIVSFSFSYILLPFLCWLIGRYYFKNKSISILIALSPILGMGEVFCHKQWTITAAITYILIFCAALFSVKNQPNIAKKSLIYIIGVFFLILALNTQSSIIMPAFFAFGIYIVLYFTKNKIEVLAWLLLVSIVLTATLYGASNSENNYELLKINDIKNYIASLSYQLGQQKSYYFFSQLANGKYILPLLFWFIGLYQSFRLKHYIVTAIILVGTFLGFIITNGALLEIPLRPDTNYYFEGTYLSFIILICLPFFILLKANKSLTLWHNVLIVIGVSYYLTSITFIYLPQRKALNNKLLLECKKLKSEENNMFVSTYDKDKLGDYCYYFFKEKTLLLSTLEDPKNPVTIFYTNDLYNYGSLEYPMYVIRQDLFDVGPFSIDNPLSYFQTFKPQEFCINRNKSIYYKFNSCQSSIVDSSDWTN